MVLGSQNMTFWEVSETPTFENGSKSPMGTIRMRYWVSLKWMLHVSLVWWVVCVLQAGLQAVPGKAISAVKNMEMPRLPTGLAIPNLASFKSWRLTLLAIIPPLESWKTRRKYSIIIPRINFRPIFRPSISTTCLRRVVFDEFSTLEVYTYCKLKMRLKTVDSRSKLNSWFLNETSNVCLQGVSISTH